MTPEQKAAFVYAQTSLMNLEIEAMKRGNLDRERNGLACEYPQSAFYDLYHKYINGLGENALIEFFNE